MTKTEAQRALVALDAKPAENWRQRQAKRRAADALRARIHKPRRRRPTVAEIEALPF